MISPATKKKRGFKLTKNDFVGYLFILPAIFCLYYFTVKPMVSGTIMSFYDMKGYSVQEFCGFDNYIRVISDAQFVKTLWNTVQYVLWSLVVGFVLPIILAILLNEAIHLKRTFRFLIYIPSATPAVAVSLLWYFLYYPNAGGMLNSILGQFGIAPYGWLQDSKWTILYIIISMTWQGAGATMMYYFASLQSLNREMYEAAIIDGAGVWRRMRAVTLPTLYPVILLFLAKQIIGVFSVLQEPMQMTGGGPNGASMTLSLQIYQYGFVDYKPQYALALSVIQFLILLVMTCFYFKLDKKVSE